MPKRKTKTKKATKAKVPRQIKLVTKNSKKQKANEKRTTAKNPGIDQQKKEQMVLNMAQVSDPLFSDYSAYLTKLESLREKEQFCISKDNVTKELNKRKEAYLKNTLHCRGEAQGLLFYPQAKNLSNWILLQNAHTFDEKTVKYNVFVHKSKVPEPKLLTILDFPGCVEVSAAEIGPVENKGVIYKNETHLAAKIWCGSKSNVKFPDF